MLVIEAAPTDHFTPGTDRVCGQSREVPVGTNTADSIQYLRFLVDSKLMKISLTKEKVQMMTTCVRVQQKHSLPVWEISHKLIGKMTVTLPAIYQTSLWHPELQCQALQSPII